MAEAFDPYRKWLGIPQEEQPPNHYRLLGIARFEDDPDVIENAADRQMAHVRTYQNGKHSALSQQILNELAAAKLTLLQAEKKTSYDEELREAEAPAAPPEEAPPPRTHAPSAQAPAEPEVGDDLEEELASLSGVNRPPARGRGVATAGPQPKVSTVKAPAPTRRKPAAATVESKPRGSVLRTRRKKNSPLLIVFSGVGLLFAVILVVVVLATQGGGPDEVTGNDSPPAENDGGRGPRPFELPEDSGQEDQPNQPLADDPSTVSDNGNGGDPETGSDFPDVGSGTTDPIGPQATNFSGHMTAAREAIAQRNKDQAAEHLASADRMARGRQQREQLEHLQAINSFVEQFWGDVFSGANKLNRLDEDDEDRTFPIGQSQCVFLSFDRGKITLQVDGTEETWAFRELPVLTALQLASRCQRDQNDSRISQAAFLLLDAERENDIAQAVKLQLARRLYEAAANAQGQENEFLNVELKQAGLEPITLSSTGGSTPITPEDGEEPSESDPEEGDPEGDPDQEPKPDPTETDPEAGDPENPEDPAGEETAADDDTRWPVPEGAALASASSSIAEEIRGDLSAASRSDEVKVELIRTLMLRSSTEQDQARRYAYLERARDLASGMGHAELMVEVIEEIGKSYRIDTLAEQVGAMRACGLKIERPEAYEKFVEVSCNLCLAAIDAQREDLLAQASSILESTATRLRASPQRAQATTRWFAEYAEILPLVEEARATLEDNPEDPDANQTLGIYLWFFQNNGKDGRPLLEKASDQTLRELAVDSADPPDEADPRVALADRWMQLATSGRYGIAASQGMVRHALAHYNFAKNQKRGRERTEFEQGLNRTREAFEREEAYMPR